MDIIFDYIRVDTFWKILLFIHFLMAVGLLAAVTLQLATERTGLASALTPASAINTRRWWDLRAITTAPA